MAFRLTEQWTQSALSVFRWQAGPTVAYSTFAGIPWLCWIRKVAGGRIHFWPFDGWELPPEKSVLFEAYPALYKRRYVDERGDKREDSFDAYATARWVTDMERRGALGRYLEPPLTDAERERAMREGWILGVA